MLKDYFRANRAPAMAVFDGMGGESCGEMAAFLASDEFGRFYRANRQTAAGYAGRYL